MSSVTSLKPSALLEAMDTPSIVVFHAPWCGHCKNLMPVVNEMAQQHSSSSKPMRVYKIDASKYGSEMRAQSADFQNIMDDVPGFPTIVFFGNGQRHVYSGPRTKGAISTQFAAYLNNKLQGGGDNAADELRPEDVRVVQDGMVLFHWNKCGHCKRFMPAWQEFEAWSQSNAENITVGAIECPSTAEGRVLAQEHGVRGFPTIRVFQNGEATDYEGARSLAALRSFANTTFSGASEEEILSASEEEQLSSIVSGGGSAITDHLDRTIKALQQAQNRKQMETAFSKSVSSDTPNKPSSAALRKPVSLKATAVPDLLGRDKAILLVHASWCGACVRYMPDFEKLAATAPKDVTVARVEWDKYGNTIQTNKVGTDMIKGGLAAHVKSFPSIFVVQGGKVHKYTGSRDELPQKMAQWFQ